MADRLNIASANPTASPLPLSQSSLRFMIIFYFRIFATRLAKIPSGSHEAIQNKRIDFYYISLFDKLDWPLLGQKKSNSLPNSRRSVHCGKLAHNITLLNINLAANSTRNSFQAKDLTKAEDLANYDLRAFKVNARLRGNTKPCEPASPSIAVGSRSPT